MDVESLRNYILSLPLVEEKFPFDQDTLCFYIAGKIFALISLKNSEFMNLKCSVERVVELREHYDAIRPGWHMDKKSWNSVYLHGDVDDNLFFDLVRHSYNCVLETLPQKTQAKYEKLS